MGDNRRYGPSGAVKNQSEKEVTIVMDDIIYIKIDALPSLPGYIILIKEQKTKRLLARVNLGEVAEIHSAEDLEIYFCGMSDYSMLVTKVSPRDGGRYLASWGNGMFGPAITSCRKVDEY